MTNKVCVVAGVGLGIGYAVAHRFAREGFDIALIARKQDALEKFAQELALCGVKVGVYPTDLADSRRVVIGKSFQR